MELRLSIVIPCFNQGRFLIDCLESVAIQGRAPFEVLLVNDGSTDRQTIDLFERLPHFSFPFPLRILHQPNGGPAAARNRGINHARGDAVVFVDGDDKLHPDALETFATALTQSPEVDVVYPDVQAFGTATWQLMAPRFNPWRLCHGNFMVSCSAVRRRVFDAGCRFNEQMRSGMEDWEFWMRTCALGAFRAAPLAATALEYRQWGHSITSAVNETKVLAQIRDLHRAAGIWSDEIDVRLRKEHAPSHCLFRQNATNVAGDTSDLNDLRIAPLQHSIDELAQDRISRYAWFGEFAPERIPAMQRVLHAAQTADDINAYVFIDAVTRTPDAIIFDRFAALKSVAKYRRPLYQTSQIVEIRTTGTRRLLVDSMQRTPRLPQSAFELLPRELQRARCCSLLPHGHDSSERVAKETWHFLERAPETPRRIHSQSNRRVLALALSHLGHGAAETAALWLLQEKSLRFRFDELVLLVLGEAENPQSARFEPIVDEIVHWGNQGLTAAAKSSLAAEFCRVRKVTDLFICDSQPGFDLIPLLKQEKIPIRVTAQIHETADESSLDLPTGSPIDSIQPPHVVAARYANLLERVACSSPALARRMTADWYFPPARLKTIPIPDSAMSNEPSSPADRESARALIDWLFAKEARSASIDSVFGIESAA